MSRSMYNGLGTDCHLRYVPDTELGFSPITPKKIIVTSPATLPKNPCQQKTAPVFLHKERRKPAVTQLRNKDHTHETYLEATLPEISFDSPHPEKEAVETLSRLLSFLF
jgi:hypothetical protein